MLPMTLRNFTAFIDGFGWAGKIEEGKAPTLTIATEEYEGGGMAGAIDLDVGSVEKMEATMNFAEFNPTIFSQFGKDDASFTLRGAQSNGTETQEVRYQMRGLFKQLDPQAFKKGERSTLNTMLSVRYLELTIAGTQVIEIDQVNMLRVVNGTDQLAEQRAALGI